MYLYAEDTSQINFSYIHLTLLVALISAVALAFSYYRTGHKTGQSELPGPRLARYSNLWRIQNGNSGSAPQTFHQLHRKYGKVVRIGPNHVSISDPALVSIVYGVLSKFTK